MPQTQQTAGVLLWEYLGLCLIPTEQKLPCPQQGTALAHEDVSQKGRERPQDLSSHDALTEPRDLFLELWKHRKIMRQPWVKAQQPCWNKRRDQRLSRQCREQLQTAWSERCTCSWGTNQRDPKGTRVCRQWHKDLSKFMESQLSIRQWYLMDNACYKNERIHMVEPIDQQGLSQELETIFFQHSCIHTSETLHSWQWITARMQNKHPLCWVICGR